MAKILFDIVIAQEADEWLNSHLVMEISAHIFSYAVISPVKKILQLRFYELHAANNHDLAAEIDGLIGTDGILKEKMQKKTLIYNFPENHLVPEKYFHTDADNDLIELLHGDLNKGIILSEKLRGFDQYNVFRVPAEIHNLMQRSFENGKYWHYYSLWMECMQKHAIEHEAYLCVLFYPNRILVAAVKNNLLNLLQSYIYEAAEDVGYYLLNICRQLQFPTENTPVILSGMIDRSSALYTEIFKYFGQVTLEGFPDILPIPALEEFPPHFFSPLLKMAICVS